MVRPQGSKLEEAVTTSGEGTQSPRNGDNKTRGRHFSSRSLKGAGRLPLLHLWWLLVHSFSTDLMGLGFLGVPLTSSTTACLAGPSRRVTVSGLVLQLLRGSGSWGGNPAAVGPTQVGQAQDIAICCVLTGPSYLWRGEITTSEPFL